MYAFNSTMVKIWREKISMLRAIRSGRLFNSVVEVGVNSNGEITSFSLLQKFLLYGLYVDAGVGSNTWKGNPGDLGYDNRRERKRWFSKKYYASVMNLREFMAENLGKQACYVITNRLR